MTRRLSFFAVLLAATASTANAAEHTKDSLETVKKNVDAEKAVLVDVREAAEWKAGRLAKAELISLSSLKTQEGLEAAVKSLPKDQPIYLHCRSGRRCLAAGSVLAEKGFDVRPLKAGYADLVEAGFEKAK